MLAEQHGLKFHNITDSGILHFSATPKARMKAFKSFLRKYKLHYRAERTQEGEESGVQTMKIRTDRDHKLMKLQRKKHQINKNKKTKKNRPSKSIGLIMSGLKVEADPKDIKEELDLSNSDWSKLEKAGFTSFLHMTIPTILQYRDLLDEVQWLFDQLHEHELSTKYDDGIKQVNQLLDVIALRLRSDPDFENLKHDLYTIQDEIAKLYKLLLNICGVFKLKVTEESQRPVTAFVQELSPYWSVLSDIWNTYKEAIFIPYWTSYASEMDKQLRLLTEEVDVVKESSVHKLVSIQQLLRKNTQYRMAEDLETLIDRSKEETLSSGQVPAAKSATGGWRVAMDDCPNTSLPTKYTQITEKFAYCKVKQEGKKCPAFRGVHGENVLCAEAGTYRQSSFFSVIATITDEDVLKQLLAVSKEDNQVLMLFKKAEANNNELYFARISDDRIKMILDHYPSSKRVSHHSYIIYHVAGEPVMLASDIVICADKSLLQELDKGTPMAKVATIRTAAVLRMTFTGNAMRDTNFIDYFRSLNAVKYSENTWDIPFKNEADKERILTDIQKDFGYPIQVFQIVENIDRTLAPWTYDVMAMTVVAQTRVVSNLEYTSDSSKLMLSDKLYDIASLSGDTSNKLQTLAASLRVQANYVVASKEEVSFEDGYYYVNHLDGTRLMTSSGKIAELHQGQLLDIETGEALNTTVAYIESEAAKEEEDDKGDHSIVIKISPEAFPSLMQMFKMPALVEMPEMPRNPPSATGPISILPSPEAPCGCTDSPENDENKDSPEGNFVTFSPHGGESRPKITFLTPETPKKS